MPLTAEQRQQLKETFDDIDKDKSGSLSQDELREVMNLFSRRRPSSRHVARVFKAADSDGDGAISFDEFVAAMEKVQLGQEEEWKIAFEAFDTDGSGSIEPKEFEEACKKIGIALSKTDIEVLMDEFDKDDNKRIDFKEFVELLQSLEAA
jgi:Ca2+-binding EF-hand superfamily protein